MTATRTVKVQKIYLFYNFARASNFFVLLFSPSRHDYDYPGYQRSFSRAAGIFGVGLGVGRRPKPREKSFRAGHCKDLTEPETALEKCLAPRGDYNVKVPNLSFCGRRKQATTHFLS